MNKENNIISSAADIASIILDYALRHDEARNNLMTTVGYATQMLLHHASEYGDEDYHEMSKEYRDFLSKVEIDIVRMINASNYNNVN